jgi:hypothetical protein
MTTLRVNQARMKRRTNEFQEELEMSGIPNQPPGEPGQPAQPFGPGAPPPHGKPNAANQVVGPAIGLIVVGVLGILLALYFVVSSAVTLAMPEAMFEEAFDEEELRELEEVMTHDQMMQLFQGLGVFGIVVNIIALAASILIIIAAMKMMKLQSHGLAVTGSVLAMIPCISPCCIFGLPIGIWSLVVLTNSEVKSAFRKGTPGM